MVLKKMLLFQQLPLNGLEEDVSHMIIPGPVGRMDLLLFQQLPLNGLEEDVSHMIIPGHVGRMDLLR
jgi:hypothetical protein